MGNLDQIFLGQSAYQLGNLSKLLLCFIHLWSGNNEKGGFCGMLVTKLKTILIKMLFTTFVVLSIWKWRITANVVSSLVSPLLLLPLYRMLWKQQPAGAPKTWIRFSPFWHRIFQNLSLLSEWKPRMSGRPWLLLCPPPSLFWAHGLLSPPPPPATLTSLQFLEYIGHSHLKASRWQFLGLLFLHHPQGSLSCLLGIFVEESTS